MYCVWNLIAYHIGPCFQCRRQGGRGQQMTWQREMKNATVSLSRVGSSHLPGWDPKDSSTRWLDTLKDMAMNREQWINCCHFLSGQIVWRWLLDRSDRNFRLLAKMVYFLLWSSFYVYFIPRNEIMIIRKLTLSTCCVSAAVDVKHYCNAVCDDDDDDDHSSILRYQQKKQILRSSGLRSSEYCKTHRLPSKCMDAYTT